jgi:carbamate kinase
MLTDVPAVQAGWGTPEAHDLGHVSAQRLRAMPFADGSMGPKVEAACRFAETTGGVAGIGALADARAILEGRRGTRVNAAERFTPQELDAIWER